MNDLIRNLDSILAKFSISSTSRKLFIEKTNILEFPKNKIVFLEAEKNNFEYIILLGILHRYNLSEKGDAVTTGFYFPESVVTPHFARTRNHTNIFSLQALTDCSIAEISVKDLDIMRYSNLEFRLFGQNIVENEFSQNFFNEIVFRSYSAKERLFVSTRRISKY